MLQRRPAVAAAALALIIWVVLTRERDSRHQVFHVEDHIGKLSQRMQDWYHRGRRYQIHGHKESDIPNQ